MEKVNLRAKEKHYYDKRPLMPGDEYEATPEHAKILTILGRAEYMTMNAPTGNVIGAEYVKDAPTYQTRAMTAEQPALLIKRRGRPRKQ